MNLISDLPGLRKKLSEADSSGNKMGSVWRCVKRLAYEEPRKNPWYLPFVAVIEDDKKMVELAKSAISEYLDGMEKSGSRGYLFNIWCFAFPHCRWAIWFDLLRQAGYYTKEEEDEIAARFIVIQFTDNYAGLMIKPYPQSVDNQCAALVLSCYIVGSLFADSPGSGNMARKLRDESAVRLEAMIGGMPKCGYSGEGSTYQGRIVAFAVPFLTMVLEDLHQKNLLDAQLQPNGTSPKDILEMTARLWMPGGLLLPWDDYGYQFGISFPLAFLADRSGEPQYLRMLEQSVGWSRLNIVSSGWGFDEPILSLIFWPEDGGIADLPAWKPWLKEDLGGALVDDTGEHYLMQMWDITEFMCVRCHVNPNSLVLTYKGTPFCADGSFSYGCKIKYPGAVFERNFGPGSFQSLNLSKGCAGSHNCVLIDNNEGFRPTEEYEHSCRGDLDSDSKSITGDVAPLYKDRYPDCQVVKRRSSLQHDRFWLVEDLVAFENEHEYSSRWFFRPDAAAVKDGVDVLTPEGKLLQMRALLGNGEGELKRIDKYPKEPDDCSDRVDYKTTGKEARWLWLFWPTNVYSHEQDLLTDWKAVPLNEEFAHLELLDFSENNTFSIHPGSLPWLQADTPIVSHWVFRIFIKNIPGAKDLRLPRCLGKDSRLWISRKEVDLKNLSFIMPKYIDMEESSAGEIEIILLTNFATGHKRDEVGISAPDTPMAICEKDPNPEVIDSYCYKDGKIVVKTTKGAVFNIDYQVMEKQC